MKLVFIIRTYKNAKILRTIFILGILKDQGDGTIIYKSASKVLCGEREISFYESIQNGQDPFMNMLKELTPQYRGTVKLSIGGKQVCIFILYITSLIFN